MNFYKKNQLKQPVLPSPNSGLAQLGFEANFKVGFVLGSSVLNRYFWLIKSPTDAKPRDVVRYLRKKPINRDCMELNLR